jgi:hypothetical protein
VEQTQPTVQMAPTAPVHRTHSRSPCFLSLRRFASVCVKRQLVQKNTKIKKWYKIEQIKASGTGNRKNMNRTFFDILDFLIFLVPVNICKNIFKFFLYQEKYQFYLPIFKIFTRTGGGGA